MPNPKSQTRSTLNVNADALNANLMKAFTVDTEAAHVADVLPERAEPKLVRPNSVAVFVRAVLLLPIIPPLVLYVDTKSGLRGMRVFN